MDGILVSLWGSDIVRFMRYGKESGFLKKFKGEIIFPVGGSVEVFMGLGFLNNPTNTGMSRTLQPQTGTLLLVMLILLGLGH